MAFDRFRPGSFHLLVQGGVRELDVLVHACIYPSLVDQEIWKSYFPTVAFASDASINKATLHMISGTTVNKHSSINTMGLQRTPPPGAQTAAPRPPPDVGPSTSEQANTSLEAFVPRHPRVMRSPQSGSTSSGSRQMAPPPPPAVVPVPELEMEMDEGEGAGDISTTPRTEPPEQAASAISQNAQPSTSTDMPPPPATRPAPDAFTTPLPKRRKSRNDPRPAVANAPPPPPPAQEPEDEEEEGELTQFERNAMYGKMYKGLMDTLDVAVSAASQRWT
jgi:hypothetical protein